MENVLLSLRYPKYDLEALDSVTRGAITEKLERYTRESEEAFQKDVDSGAYRPIEGRDVTKHIFIDHCRCFSRDFSIDLDVVEHETCITADFYFDSMAVFSHLISAMIMADDIIIISENEEGRSVLGLKYNTQYKFPVRDTQE